MSLAWRAHIFPRVPEVDASDVFMEMEKVRDDGHGHTFTLSIKEFFKPLGRDQRTRFLSCGKTTHARRKILFFDELTIAPSLLYLLRPLWRGDRKFTIHVAGEEITVELDEEMIAAFAGNPANSYDARKDLPWGVIEDGILLHVPVLHRYRNQMQAGSRPKTRGMSCWRCISAGWRT